ncbi:amino acid ABC transporter ATP-binding protein [Mesorhizobium sp. B2-4-19]|nr:amino acid ABC transporter ATP-binding protein [Mesorhizobium sp. B2-4-19]
MLHIEGLGKSFRGSAVLKDVNLIVRRGETVAIIGPSGSGKTTLLRSVNFLTPYDTGRVLINGELMGYTEKDGKRRPATDAGISRLRRSTGMVFQRFALFQHMTVLQNVIEGPVYVLGLSREEARKRAVAALATVGLTGKEDHYPAQLSGGQQQRVGIARALCMQPDIMLFDEPTSALDPELVGEVLGTMRRLREEHRTMLIVTHEIGFAADVADRIVFMEAGAIVDDRPAGEFFARPKTTRIAAFLSRHSGGANFREGAAHG